MTSIDSPANTTLTAQFAATADGAGGVDVGSAAVTGGAASIDVTFPASASGAGFLILTAQPTGRRSSSRSRSHCRRARVTATAAATQYGSSPKVKVTVTAEGLTPTGTVTVSDAGGATLGSAALTNGAATVALGRTALLPGTHTLTVAYSGSGSVAASSATVELVVKKASSTTIGFSTSLVVKKGSTPKITTVHPGERPRAGCRHSDRHDPWRKGPRHRDGHGRPCQGDARAAHDPRSAAADRPRTAVSTGRPLGGERRRGGSLSESDGERMPRGHCATRHPPFPVIR